MDKDRVAGAGKKRAGSVKEAVGKATGDRRTVAKGKRQKTEGKAQGIGGKIKDALRKK
jgi:uncharacterized protein YjbJ (UPF0337 family)